MIDDWVIHTNNHEWRHVARLGPVASFSVELHSIVDVSETAFYHTAERYRTSQRYHNRTASSKVIQYRTVGVQLRIQKKKLDKVKSISIAFIRIQAIYH